MTGSNRHNASSGRRPRRARGAPAGIVVVLSAAWLLGTAEAGAAGAQAAEPGDLAVSWQEDATLAVTMLSFQFLLGSIQPFVPGDRCGWCDDPGPVDRAARSAFLAPDPPAAALASDVLLWAAIPSLLLVSEIVPIHLRREPWTVLLEDLVLVIESFALAGMLTNLVKLAVRRPRPYAALGGGASLYPSDEDELMSFFSGHASCAAALAASMAAVAVLRGRRIAPWIAAAGAALALTVGALRMSADKHYLSDVLVGLGVGTAAGVAVPLLHALPLRGRKAPAAMAAPGPGTLSLILIY